MSAINTPSATNFDGIHVSKGFVRGLQGQVLKLEQIQQSLIQQLEHANKLASEYHATAVAWKHKYDAAMHKMNEMKDEFERETLLHADRECELIRFQQHLEGHLEKALSSNSLLSSPSPSRSPSPAHPHHDNNDEFPRHPRDQCHPFRYHHHRRGKSTSRNQPKPEATP